MPHGTPRITLQRAAKPAWRSRTLWFNLAIAALAAAEAASGLLQTLLPGNVYGWLVFALTVGNATLRVVTTTGVCVRSAVRSDAISQEQQP